MPSQQAETIAFLASHDGFGSDAIGCATVVTHISTVLIIGDKAIKLKKPVKLSYLDFSTPEKRLQACLAELQLNRRTAPQLYRAVHRITRGPAGSLTLNGSGTLVDAAVEMVRFDDRLLFDAMARRGELSTADMDQLARRIAEFHATADIVTCDGALRFATLLAGIERNLASTGVFSSADVAEVIHDCCSAMKRNSDLLNRRAHSGKVRRCHGDLHLRNICVIDGKPTLFDCLEFDTDLATVDVLYDLAFVLMDLWHRKLPGHANVLFNGYLDMTADEEGVALLPLFLSLRALIRAHVAASEIAQTELASAWARAEARSYFTLARSLLAPSTPVLVAVGGYSGSGKSTIAARLAPEIGPAPGARILNSDRIRNYLYKVEPETRLGIQAYSAAVSKRVYATLLWRAEVALAAGHCVIADAVFNRPSARERLAAIAAQYRAPYHALWLDAPADVLMRRVAERVDAVSDATPAVVMGQVGGRNAPTDWLRLCVGCDVDTVVDAARLAIGAQIKMLAPSKACAKMLIPSSLPALTCARIGLSAPNQQAQSGVELPRPDSDSSMARQREPAPNPGLRVDTEAFAGPNDRPLPAAANATAT